MKRIIILLLLITLIVSCTNDKNENEPDTTVKVRLANAYSNVQSEGGDATPSEENLKSLAVYICDGGVVEKIFGGLKPDLTTIEISSDDLTSSSVMYAIANGDVIEGLNEIVIGSPEVDLKELKTAQSAGNGQVTSLAMAGYTSMVNGDKALSIKLKRNLARFDLQNESQIKVKSIQITGLATENRVFDLELEPLPEDRSASVGREFTDPLTTSLKRLFYCHPSPAGGVAVIEADYNGETVSASVEMSAIRRNCIHTIRLNASNGSFTASISSSDIEDGDEVSADRITVIDTERSQLCEGVVVSDAGQRITFPAQGGEVKLFFSGNVGKVLKNGDAQRSISGFDMNANAEESSYTIKIGAQTRQGGDNQVELLSFGRPEDTDPQKWNQIVVVAMNYAPFSVVTFGDIDWMVSNGFSHNPAEYPTLRDGYDIRDLCYLATDWEKYSGKGHHWGPRTGTVSLAAWDIIDSQYATNFNKINGNIIGSPTSWTDSTVPCPSGWRVPTYDEFNMIWPPQGTLITTDGAAVSYATTLGDFSAKIETFGGLHFDCRTAMDFRDTPASTNLIITKDNKELCFPIVGSRGSRGIYNGGWYGYGWGIGSEAQYWCRDMVGSKYVAVGIKDGTISNNTNGVPHNDWIHVRCVRNVIE